MANEANIHVPNNEQVTRLIGKVEKWVDDSESKLADVDARLKTVSASDETTKASLIELRASLEGSLDVQREIKERLDEMDKLLPVGDKLYRPLVADSSTRTAEVREDFARTVLDCGAIGRNQKPRFGSSIFNRDSQTEAVAADGGYLVPPEQVNEIIRIIFHYGLARKLCRVIPMARQEMRLPTNSDFPAVYWDTQVGAPPTDTELVAPTATKATFGRPSLFAHKLIGIINMSLELEEDSIPVISSFLMDIFATSMSKAEDIQFLTAKGPSGGNNDPFTGLLYVSGIADVTGSANTYDGTLTATGSTGGYNKLIETMDAADEETAETGVWILSNSVLNAVRRVKDAYERPLWGEMSASPQDTLFGRPYYRSRVMPKCTDGGSQASKPFILFGDMSYMVMGDRKQISIDVSPHAMFKEAGLVMRVMERVAFVNALTAPFARLNTSS